MSETNKGNAPVTKFKAGAVECAVWEQTSDNGKFLTVSAHRSYLKKNGDASKTEDWEKTNSLRINDIPVMILVLQEAYKYAKLSNKEE